MKIKSTDSFQEKFDKFMEYLADISKRNPEVQELIKLNKLSLDLAISPEDHLIDYLANNKKLYT